VLLRQMTMRPRGVLVGLQRIILGGFCRGSGSAPWPSCVGLDIPVIADSAAAMARVSDYTVLGLRADCFSFPMIGATDKAIPGG